ncbi:MAG: metallophosphoesterase [Fimbriimonadaceae bacterium]|nr:metallophosphoesterase [Fimbriimonadaceae bacterium]
MGADGIGSGPEVDARLARRISRRRFLRRLALTGLGATAYSLFLEPRRLQVTTHEVILPGLPAALDGLRIAQLSDLHHSPWVTAAQVAKAVRAVNAAGVDVAVLTGDAIDGNAAYGRSVGALLAAVQAPRGRYFVYGNHDHWRGVGPLTSALQAAGWTLLNNTVAALAAGLAVAGIDDLLAGQPQLGQVLRRLNPRQPALFLSHNPRVFGELPPAPWLVLAGHTHGGQVHLPGIPRVLPPDMDGTPWVVGWYRRGAAQMYITRGIGCVVPPVRFNCPPELPVFTLRRG